MEKSWAKMKKSKQDEKRVAKETRVSIDLLKKVKQQYMKRKKDKTNCERSGDTDSNFKDNY